MEIKTYTLNLVGIINNMVMCTRENNEITVVLASGNLLKITASNEEKTEIILDHLNLTVKRDNSYVFYFPFTIKFIKQ